MQPSLIIRQLKDAVNYNAQSKPRKYTMLSIAGIVGFCAVRYALWKLYNRVRKLPNGPIGLPVFGCLLSFGRDPLQFLVHNGSVYPSLMYFPLLLANNVLISDVKMLRKLYKTEKLVDRPPMSHRTPPDVFSLSGSKCEQRRKLITKTMLSLASSSFVLSRVNESITEYVEPIMEERYVNRQGSKSCLFFPREFMLHITFNNLWAAIFGVSLSFKDPFISKYTEAIERAFPAGSINMLLELATNYAENVIPKFVKWHVVQKYSHEIDALVIDWMNTHGFNVNEHDNIICRADSNINGSQHDSLYIDVLIDAVNNKQVTVGDAVADIVLVLSAGVDTTAHSSEYLLVLLAKNPKVQQLVYDELQQVMSKHNLKTFDFRILTDLHVFRAFIYEGLRIACVSPTGLPHIAHRDVQIEVDGKQCVIPKGTVLHSNTYYVHKFTDWNNNNKPLKQENNEIHLDYWLDEQKKFIMNENFILFGVGRRNCVGQGLAMKALYAIIGVVMCKYRFLHDDAERLQIKQKMGVPLNIEPAIGIKVEKR